LPGKESIGVPTARSIGSSFKSAAYGGAAAFVVGLAQNFLGSGLLGSILGIILAGSILKGSEGAALSTILGYEAVMGGGLNLGGLLGSGSSTDTGSI
jgi:hypothetical protein